MENVSELTDALITSATLELYANGNYVSLFPSGEKDLQGGSKTLHEAEQRWDETSITWLHYGYQMGWGWYQSIGSVVATNSNAMFQTWERYDVTSVVQKHLSNPSTNNGFMIRMDDWATVSYCSSENSDTSLRPRLIIQYEGGTGVVSSKQSYLENLTVKNNELHFMADGQFAVSLLSLKGEVLSTVNGNATGQTSIPLNRFSVARGGYIVQLQIGNNSVSSLIVE